MSGKRKVADTTARKSPKRPRNTRARVKRVAKWLLILALVGGLLLAAGLFFVYKSTDIPDPNKDFETQTSFIYYADGKTELGKFATQNRESIPLKEIPQTLQDAVVAAENRTFWTDKGIDPKGIVRAAFSNVRGNSTQGASTITQQYVKILYLTQERSFERKGKEAILSLKIQNQLSKSKILEGYLNTIYFGRSAYGVQAAAKAYFDTDAKNLTLRQSAVLASVLNSPTHFDPANGRSSRQDLKERYDYVLGGMADMGTATAEKAERAAKKLPAFPKIEAQSQYGGQRGHMLTLVKQELHALGFSDEEIDGGGLRVTTTFTAKAMQAAEQGVREAKPDGFGDKELHVAVASVEPGTGALRGFYGGQDYLDSQINWAVAGGMVGSTFKPFTLATALDNGYSLKDTFQGNSPFEFPDGLTVNNEGTGSDGLGNDYGDGGERDRGAGGVHQHRVRRHVEQHPRRPRQDPGHGERPRRAADRADQEVPGPPEHEPRPGVRRADHPGQGPDQPDQHGERLRLDRQRRQAGRRARHRQGGGPVRGDALVLQAVDRERPGRGRRGRRVVRPAAGRPERHRPGRARAGPPGGRQDRHRDQQQGPGLLGVVRRLHPAARDRGDVRPG